MRKPLTSFFFLIAFAVSPGQDNIEKVSDSLVAEGRRLYRSEMASWYGTDAFLEKYKNIDFKSSFGLS